ncbi:hypothetical protein A3D00_03365 [Candidatus Woesebacteria bacterium RIFCSPHIGHO2_02_FULL_38_9]|uniref:DNA primase/polymerase bifunctional N-terminal domain-containing protein n=1 Tax=Candidatus Woesebacteria bacterium RIFCSPHIGHO2_01_FULL_39_28 TaxID=1802496 RepID=A0A1F7YEN6_9BACT|nr:MAG: hypothetical protein A2627_01570 [Candidatus Woesebacteria bacterium RIFCSPHIGHO2_01_FULL_39_28]OGM32274.1 MAG: hypothetical protein A3D00_03365 [Candidatus Woesebacteria bacterium RIFCSPHIGHO2_02_FULL_38_9]OGM56875.1 MAG: hypothetical protein A3A50_03955 [Candidatus Woesebacteria bacterium RIFCSPLOWO2_01_FULL_38_20]
MTIPNLNDITNENTGQSWIETGKVFLEHGFSIIAVGNNKRPLFSWKEYQTKKATLEEIEKWISMDSFAGFAIVTGKISNLFVLDIDNGADTSNLDIPDTVSVETGSGGKHYYFRYPNGIELGNSGGFRKKMDTRGEGGYVIAPPALHPNGNTYKWICGLDTEIAEVPKWLLDELQENKSTLADWAKSDILNGVGESMRNESATKVVGMLLTKFPKDEWEEKVWPLVQGWNQNNTPPLSEDELRTTYESIAKREMGKRVDDGKVRNIHGFEISLEEMSTIKAKKGDFAYHMRVDRKKVNIALYKDNKHVMRDYFSLDSNKARTTFANATKVTDEEKEVVKEDLMLLAGVVEDINKEILRSKKDVKEKKLSKEDKELAESLLISNTLLNDILKMIKRTGVAGEERNILVHYLVFTSRITEDPLSVVVKGESSVGKSYGVSKVMTLFPRDAYVDITDATAQSFYYAPSGHFAHKIIVIFEKHGGEKADYSIRTLQSEKKLKIQVTVKDPQTGEFGTQEHEIEGPAGFITTTTEAVIHSENETRNISIYPDESTAQTEKTFEITDAKYRGISGLTKKELKPWRNMQRLLKPYDVLIPYVEELRTSFPKKPVRVRRDYGKLLALIAVIALLHQKQREIKVIGETEYLIATLVDFHIAKVLLEETLQKTIYAIPPKSLEIIEAVKELTGDVSVRDVANKLDWDYDTVKKWFDPAYQKGFFVRTEENKGSIAAKYKLADKEPQMRAILPDTEYLYEANPKWLGEQKIYDPVTGEVFEFEGSSDEPME